MPNHLTGLFILLNKSERMETLIIIIHVVVCIFLIGIVLLQHGKGADIGATFGGSSQSLFGTEGPLPLLNKITTLSAVIFMATSVALAYFSAQSGTGSVMSQRGVEQQAVAPEADASAELVVPEAAEPVAPGQSE
jgi:preprotein translocase subunit SecG